MENTSPAGWDTVDTSSDSTAVKPTSMSYPQKYGSLQFLADFAITLLAQSDSTAHQQHAEYLRARYAEVVDADIRYD
jgi:hypothetical protein